MKTRCIINLLVVIVLAFTIKGLFTLQEVNSTIELDQAQQASITEDVGMAFDWYGLTVVDSIVQYQHHMIAPDELIKRLVDGRQHKDKLLQRYYAVSSKSEQQYIQKLKQYDAKVDAFVSKVVTNTTLDKVEDDDTIIPEMYSLTQPAVDIINTIIDAKTDESSKVKAQLYANIKAFENFLLVASVLALAIGFSGNFSKKLAE